MLGFADEGFAEFFCSLGNVLWMVGLGGTGVEVVRFERFEYRRVYLVMSQ